MRTQLTRADRLLLVLLVPVALTVAGFHLWEVARSGVAQLPVYAAPSPDGGYPVVGGYRLETDDADTVLRPGDRLIRIGDRDLRGVGYIGFDAIGLAAAGPRGAAPLVYERDGARHSTSLPAVPHPYPWSRFPSLLLLPVCALVLLRAPGSRDAQRFAAAFGTYAIVQLQFYGGPEWQTYMALLIWNLGTPVAVVLMLRFARLFPSEVPDAKRVWRGWPWLAGASYLLIRFNYLTGKPFAPEHVQPLSHACHAVYLLGTIAMLSRNYVHAEPIGRRRLKWVLLGGALGSLPLMVVQIVPLVHPDWHAFERAFALANLATALWMVGVIVAVVRFNVFDIDRLLGATATVSIVGIGGVALLLAGVPLLADRLSEVLAVDGQTTRVVLAMLLAAGALPLGRRLRPRVDSLLFPERVALQSGVEALLDELSRCRTPGSVVHRTTRRILALLSPRGFALYVRGDREFGLRRHEGLPVPDRLALDDARLVIWLGESGRVGGDDPRIAFALPFRDDTGLRAVLLLGPKRSGDVYTSTDRHLLNAVGTQASAQLLHFEKDIADEQARTKSRLLAVASHDIRQPLHALGFMVESLTGKIEPDESRALVERIQTATRDLSGLLTELLDLSKIENGVISARQQVFRLPPLLESLESELGPVARAKGLTLRVSAPDLLVESDRLLLLRILRNLVTNAVLHTEQGGVTVSARSEDDRIWLEVNDTGPGIAPDRQREIFHEFHKRPGSPGAGLGLAIVDGLASLLGHELAVRSVPGVGSTFAVAVARATGPVEEEESTRALLPLLDVLRGRRVAVVDDDTEVLEATRLLLGGWGCEVRVATDRAGAETWLEEGWRPDFVLSDYHLGGRETGPVVIERLRQCAGVDVPAALVTADTSPDRLAEMRATGLPVLQKPLAPARLRAVLSQALARPGAQPGSA